MKTAGAIRAAKIIEDGLNKYGANFWGYMSWAEIINEETHAPEMLAFIEKVASSEYSRDTIMEAQDEAFALIKKVRGL